MPNEPVKLGPRPVATNPSERRRTVRYPFTASAEVVDTKSLTKVIGRSSDLGRGGCYIDTICPMPEGSVVTVRLASEQRSFEAQAKVMYSQNGMGMGLAFQSAEPEQLKVLDRWIDVLSGNAPKSPAVAESVRTPVAPPPPLPRALAETEPTGDQEPRFVLNELIITLMRKRVLTETEGKALLQKLLG
jgi:hypothetical protein